VKASSETALARSFLGRSRWLEILGAYPRVESKERFKALMVVISEKGIVKLPVIPVACKGAERG
jgi:hypothetical protein